MEASGVKKKVFKLPIFLKMHTRLSSAYATHSLYTKVCLQKASLYIIPSIPLVQFKKGAANVFLSTIWQIGLT